jgi:hypothetical protein
MLQDQCYPDLVIDGCPNGCSNCAGIYINSTIGHKIICKCSCGHHKARGRRGHNNISSLDDPSFLKQSASKRPISTSTVIETDDASASSSAH